MTQHTLTNKTQRDGVVVEPYHRLSIEQVRAIHGTSLEILQNIGIVCESERVKEIFGEHGAEVVTRNGGALVKLPRELVEGSIEAAPPKVLLGARNPENRLILDGAEPRVRFGTGSETNIWLETEYDGRPASELMSLAGSDPKGLEKALRTLSFREERGMLEHLCRSARLCEHLDSVDFFIRNVNIQDPFVNDENKDVNVFFASLSNITKHVMAGINRVESLPDVIRMAEMIAGGADAFRENPVISFITCVIKSPLQVVDETAEKLIAVAERGIPLVISSSPQGGATGPIDEGDMVAMINAEILAGITLAQFVRSGTPVLYGSVPARARLDTLHNMYGAPESNQYNVDCVQMARFYNVPCYSTAGVSDALIPGIQATMEKMFSHMTVAMSGPQYLHYAFGLLDKTNVFCPAQAVLDDAHIAAIKHFCRRPEVAESRLEKGLGQLRQVMESSHKLFARYARKGMRSGSVYSGYPFETWGRIDTTLLQAGARASELMQKKVAPLPAGVAERIYESIDGLSGELKPSD